MVGEYAGNEQDDGMGHMGVVLAISAISQSWTPGGPYVEGRVMTHFSEYPIGLRSVRDDVQRQIPYVLHRQRSSSTADTLNQSLCSAPQSSLKIDIYQAEQIDKAEEGASHDQLTAIPILRPFLNADMSK